jgi:hypothetical protein
VIRILGCRHYRQPPLQHVAYVRAGIRAQSVTLALTTPNLGLLRLEGSHLNSCCSMSQSCQWLGSHTPLTVPCTIPSNHTGDCMRRVIQLCLKTDHFGNDHPSKKYHDGNSGCRGLGEDWTQIYSMGNAQRGSGIAKILLLYM